MRKRQTFVDPETGEEMVSTWLACIASWLVFGLFFGLAFGLVGGVLGWLVFGVLFGLIYGLFSGLSGGLIAGLLVPELETARSFRFTRWAHDGMARRQHRRRQRLLRSQEEQHVPDTAISRAQPPGAPQPTDAALSIAVNSDESTHLTVETEEDLEDEEPVRQ